jgi:hypothetical protein
MHLKTRLLGWCLLCCFLHSVTHFLKTMEKGAKSIKHSFTLLFEKLVREQQGIPCNFGKYKYIFVCIYKKKSIHMHLMYTYYLNACVLHTLAWPNYLKSSPTKAYASEGQAHATVLYYAYISIISV